MHINFLGLLEKNKKNFISPQETSRKQPSSLSPTLEKLRNGFVKKSDLSDTEDEISDEELVSPGLAAIKNRENMFNFSDSVDAVTKQEGNIK